MIVRIVLNQLNKYNTSLQLKPASVDKNIDGFAPCLSLSDKIPAPKTSPGALALLSMGAAR